MMQILGYLQITTDTDSRLLLELQQSTRMSKKDGVISRSVRNGNLSHYVDFPRIHGEHFSSVERESCLVKDKGMPQSTRTHVKLRLGLFILSWH